MKKLFSIFMIIVIFAIGCISTTMAYFTFDEMEMDMSQDVQHEEVMVMDSDCCETMSLDCEKTSHECCFSPFKGSSNISWANNDNWNKKLKIKVFSFDVLALLQESSEYNFIERLNSPPDGVLFEINTNSYIWLTWITKSNC